MTAFFILRPHVHQDGRIVTPDLIVADVETADGAWDGMPVAGCPAADALNRPALAVFRSAGGAIICPAAVARHAVTVGRDACRLADAEAWEVRCGDAAWSVDAVIGKGGDALARETLRIVPLSDANADAAGPVRLLRKAGR